MKRNGGNGGRVSGFCGLRGFASPMFRTSARVCRVGVCVGRIGVQLRFVPLWVLAAAVSTAGCRGPELVRYIDHSLPGEAREATMTEVVINPPDILYIEIEPSVGGKALQPGDELLIDIKPSARDPHILEAAVVRDDGFIQLRTASEELKIALPPVNVKGLKAALIQEKIAGL